MTTLDEKRIMRPPTPDPFLPVRGADGRLYGRFDPQRLLLEVRKGKQVEVIDLKALKVQG